MSRLEDAATVVDEVHGFKFFDERDLLGFVDGTENPSAQAAVQATLIGDEDPGLDGRQLRDHPEVPAQPEGLERAARGAAIDHQRPQEAVRHRAAPVR